MCRMLGYIGEPVSLVDVLFETMITATRTADNDLDFEALDLDV